jgi:hypothetical protein
MNSQKYPTTNNSVSCKLVEWPLKFQSTQASVKNVLSLRVLDVSHTLFSPLNTFKANSSHKPAHDQAPIQERESQPKVFPKATAQSATTNFPVPTKKFQPTINKKLISHGLLRHESFTSIADAVIRKMKTPDQSGKTLVETHAISEQTPLSNLSHKTSSFKEHNTKFLHESKDSSTLGTPKESDLSLSEEQDVVMTMKHQTAKTLNSLPFGESVRTIRIPSQDDFAEKKNLSTASTLSSLQNIEFCSETLNRMCHAPNHHMLHKLRLNKNSSMNNIPKCMSKFFDDQTGTGPMGSIRSNAPINHCKTYRSASNLTQKSDFFSLRSNKI